MMIPMTFHRGSAENSEEVWNERDLYCEPIRMFPADVSFDGLSAGCFFRDMGNVI